MPPAKSSVKVELSGTLDDTLTICDFVFEVVLMTIKFKLRNQSWILRQLYNQRRREPVALIGKRRE